MVFAFVPVEAVWGLLPVVLMSAGFLLLWIASWYARRRAERSAFMSAPLILTGCGWFGLMLGLLGCLVGMTLVFSPVLILILAAVIVAGLVRYRLSEVRYLIWLLAESAERGIPLERAARAFAGERRAGVAASAQNLAAYLEVAMPLSVALPRSGLWTSKEVLHAADVGEKTGTLGTSLKWALQRSSALDGLFSSLWAKFLYLTWLVFTMVAIVSFVMIKIIPVFQEMFEEFGLELPGATVLLIECSRYVASFWFILFPLLLLLFWGVLVGLLLFVGVPIQSLPIIRLIVAPLDNSTVLHSLATAVRHRQSIPETLQLLEGLTRSSRSRRRLAQALQRIHDGADWTEALQRVGFITSAQRAIIKSAERVGNLDWALTELADSVIRRTAQRVQAVLSFVFPACLVMFGVCVFFVAVGVLTPLFSLIGMLA
jgi:type IV pilus assembly protein PilC